MKALCVAPFGMEEGTDRAVPGQEFGLVVGEPAEFRFLGSNARRDDAVGTLVEDWEGRDRRTGPGRDDAEAEARATAATARSSRSTCTAR